MAKPSENTTPERHARVADAILDLINAKPRSPTRAELVAALAGWERLGTAANDNGAPSPWHPSDLGQRLMDGVPRWAAAFHADCNKNDLVRPRERLGDAACEDIDRRCREAESELSATGDAILDRFIRSAFDGRLDAGNVCSHLVDLALVINLHDDGRPAEEMDSERAARTTMVVAVLSLAGIEPKVHSLPARLRALEEPEDAAA